jgi:hypothetical protein
LAQDVEKKHPEAVGLAGGYKTVNYKKATEDAVHKAEGGAATDAYAINPSAGNSQMLQENSGKGLGVMPSLPQMITGPQRIEAGANAAQLAALRAPQATGYSLGTREGKEAELASLQSSLAQPPGPNGDLLGSGPQYLQSRINTLQDWLNKNNSQGGLVSGPGNFAQGGLAGGRHGFYGEGYVNPWFEANKGAAQQGDIYGAKLQPMPQRQMTQGTPMQAPQQRQQPDAATSALNMAKLVQTGNEAYKARPDFLRTDADIAARKTTEAASKVAELQKLEWAKEHGIDVDTLLGKARGGLIGDRHHYSRGGINPYGGNSVLGPILEEQEQQPQPQMMKADNSNKQQPKQQESNGLGDVMKAKKMYDMGDKAYKWGADKLGADKAMSATSTEAVPTALESATAPSGGVIDLTTTAPGLGAADTAATGAGLAGGEAAAAGATAAETAAAAATAAEVAAAAEAAAAAAAAAGTTATVGATVAEAAPFLLAFLSDERAKHDIKKVGTLFDGQPVYRYAYNGDDKTQMGLIAQKVEKSAPEAVGLAGGMKTVNYKKATDKAAKRGHYQTAGLVPPEDAPVVVEEVPLIAEGGNENAPTGGDGETKVPRAGLGAPLARPTSNVPTPADAVAPVPAPREPKPAPGLNPSKSFFPEITSEGVKDTLSSENFWVPAIAGLGSMLASPNKTLAGAIGSGLVGGTGAYTELQKQNADQLMKRLQFNKERFKGPVLIDGQERYQDTAHGDWVDEPTMQGRLAAFSGQKKLGPAPGALAPADAAVATAREELGAPKPKLETTVKPPATTPPAAIQETGAPAPAATAEAPKPPATAQAATATAQPAGEKPVDDIMAPPPSKLQLMNQARKDAALFADIPENRRPDYLEKEARRLQTEAAEYQRQADKFAADAAKLAKNPAVQTQYTNEATRLTSLATARRTEADQKNQAANAALESAIGPALANSEAIAKAQAELKFAGPKAAQALKDELAKLKATQPFTLEAKEAEYSFTENYKRQQEALKEAAKEAKDGQQLINQVNAILRTSFDDSGKATFSGGPLGSKLTNLSALMVQAGFSPSFVKDFTGTDPRNAQAARKLQTDAASEMVRIAMNGSPVRVAEFNQYLATTPGEDLLPEAMKWIAINVIKPKAESLVGAYEKVKKLDPGKHNIEAELFDYRRDNAWFNPVKISENEATQTAAPAAPAVRQLTPEEQQRRDAEVLKRRAAQGAR